VHVYSAREEANARHSGEIHWLQKLQSALRDNKFELYYQPIMHARVGGLRGPAIEVFVRLAGGASVQRIAQDLKLSASTVGTHLYNIKQKLGVQNQSELTLIAIRHKLIEA